MKHQIGHIQLDLRVADQQQAEYWSGRMQKALSRLNSPAMSKWFDQQAPEGTYVKIDRLDIQLGELRQDISSDQLVQELFTALQERLKPLLIRKEGDLASSEAILNRFQWLGHWLEQYLVHGSWPIDLLDEGPQQAWQILKKEEPERLQAIVRKAIQANGRYVAERLALQWSSEDLLWLLPSEWVRSLRIDQKASWQKPFGLPAFRELWVELLLAQFTAEQRVAPSALAILQRWWQKWQAAKPADDPAAIWKKRQQLQKWLPDLLSENQLDELLPIGDIIGREDILAKARKEKKKDSKSSPAAGSIAHAGLVIVHPFLSTCFADLGYLSADKKAFLDKDRTYTALALLHFMAAGEQPLREEQAGMYKLLCGMDLEEPIPLDIPLLEKDKAEAVQMLESLIGHWSALGKTSIDGLRESFLQRPGSLVQDELSPVLYVEQRTIDILLKKLPWGLSILRLPWLPEFIRVEWPN